jgi:PhnB protein
LEGEKKMTVEAYINFNGNCREAVEFYSDVFGTEKPKFLLFGDMPGDGSFPMDDSVKGLVMHAEINMMGSKIMFSDVPPGMPFTIGNNISLILNSNEEQVLRAIFERLKHGGEIKMELQETFWSKCYGYVVDQYGIGWQLSLDSGQ